MTTIAHTRARGRPAHTAGATYLAYTPDGTKLVTVGSNNTIRIYKTNFDGEPTNIDDCQETNLAISAANDFFVTGSEDGTVSLYSLKSMSFDTFLLRSTLPVRDVQLSPDGQWCAIASDELSVKLVNVANKSIIRTLREHGKPVKHIAYHPSESTIALSCTDGIVYVYTLDEDQPRLLRKVDGLIRSIETDSDISSKVVWHPDGRAFAAPTATRDVQVVSATDWENQRTFSEGHGADITALAWSPNGALLVTAGKDRKILLWEVKTQKIIARYEYANVVDLAWHPHLNLLSFTNTDGEVYIHDDFVPAEHQNRLSLPLQPAPFIHDPLKEISNNVRRIQPVNGLKDVPIRQIRQGSPDTVGSLLNGVLDDDDFVEDDDGAGYAVGLNGNGKRSNGHLGPYDAPVSKRMQVWQPEYHESFQPGATAWHGNRKYLSLNLIGFVWTVDQDTHHTVTVEFYDRDFQRNYHFTDTFRYDKACLNEHGTLFAAPADDATGTLATLHYRPHETWTERQDWRTQLPPGEDITSISLSSSFITVTTSANYVRIYTLYLTPYRVYRQKSSPAVTCASWRDYVLTMGNGSVGADGRTQLLYTITNVKRDEICQAEDIVALEQGTSVKNVFFSDQGDPCIYDTTGVLLVLLHWRTPAQAQWVPLLDTTQLSRLASGRKTETYWPVAVADGKFHCIILKGGDQYPYFPRPLLSEFDFQIPIGGPARKSREERNVDGELMDEDDAGNGDDRDEQERLEEQFVRQQVETALMADMVDATAATHTQRSELARRELEVNKTLLQLLARECIAGEERGMKALELVELMRDDSGRMVEAAVKIAERYGRSVLSGKIREVGVRRMGGEEDVFD